MSAGRHSRDPRPVTERGFSVQCARSVAEFLVSRGFSRSFPFERLLKDVATKDFFDIFRFLVHQLDPLLEIEGKMEDEVPPIMRRLKYPVEVNRSKLQAFAGPTTWPQLLALLDWLVVLIHIHENLIEPVATCQLGLDAADQDRDGGEHLVLRSLFENYQMYLRGNDDCQDEERLRQIYEERIEALEQETDRLKTHHMDMQQRLQGLQDDHEKFLELQKAPLQLEIDAERLRGIIQSQEARVRRVEAEIDAVKREEKEQLGELEGLQAAHRSLAEQVQGQAYSKRDIERLKVERTHLLQVQQGLRAELDKGEHDVWELEMQEKTLTDKIDRLVRLVNVAAESLGQALTGEEADPFAQDLRVRIDLSEPCDALAAMDFEELRVRAQAAVVQHAEVAQHEEITIHAVNEERRLVQEELSASVRECRRLKMRLEQLARKREEYCQWSAEQLDEAQRMTEANEDELHEVAIGAAAPSYRDAAEVERLRLMLNWIRSEGATEKAQLEELIKRDEERFEECRRAIKKELETYAKDAETLSEDVEAAVEEDEIGHARRHCKGGC